MAFIFYSLAAGMLAFAYEQPDLFLMVVMLVGAKRTLWRTR